MNAFVSRRSMLAVMTASTALPMTPIMAASRFDLPSLVERHKLAAENVRRLSGEYNDIYDAADLGRPRVRYSWLLTGRDDDGNDIKEPLYAYCRVQIEQIIEKERRTLLSISFSGTDRVNARCEGRKARLIAELEEELRLHLEAEEDAGITAADEALNAADAELDALTNAFLALRPTTLGQLRATLSHLMWCFEDESVAIAESDVVETIRAWIGEETQ